MTKRILVVEDQEDNRRIMRDLLTTAGFEVIEAMDGQEGLNVAATERPDLILMDLQLPVFDGLEVTRRIRSVPAVMFPHWSLPPICMVHPKRSWSATKS